jgi:hypothetical protein
MHRAVHLLFFLLLLQSEVKSQIFDYFHPNFSADGPAFRADFISQNKIRKVKVSYQKKRDGRPMESIADKDEIHFDREGNEYERFQTRQNRVKTDSIRWVKMFSSNRLIRETKFDALGEYQSEWLYDKEGNVENRTFTRNGIIISRETVSWSGTQCLWKNNDQKAYLREEFEYDQYQRLTRKKEILLISEKFRESNYVYDEIGRIAQIIEKSIEGKITSYNYNYSRPGELLSVNIKSGDSKEEDLEILYEKGLPTAFIQRDVQTNTMRIGMFEFEFYP